MKVHLVDGTYELYRQHYGQATKHATPPPFAATIGVLASTLQLIADGATHIGVASDHIIESFRNDLYEGYKTSEGMEPVILHQIPLVEDALRAMGVVVWAMEEFEADDALGSAARVAANDKRVQQVVMLTPDKDLGQCVEGKRVVQFDRRNNVIIDDAAVREKFGVGPASIADYLALVGDTSDGFPGLAGWGAKSAATVLAKFEHIEAIPDDETTWDIAVRGATKLGLTLRENRELAALFKKIATVVTTVNVGEVDDWQWHGPTAEFSALCDELGSPQLAKRSATLAQSR
ncbi:MAG: flap endonuclease [Ilumatobacteraceae bacterium]|nr:flap endonuclease [Ilumatobacteraceae bacterium]